MPISRLFYFLFAGALLVAVMVGGSSCKKEQFLSSGGELRFSTDTLTFDTVFTTMGSATVAIKIYNPQSQKVTVSSVRMGRGGSSPFRLNVDGNPREGANIEIAANDSVYVFATVKVDPNDQNSPFVVEDRLIATLNGNEFSIPVMAYGQNAHYIVDDWIDIETLETDKPYVMIGNVGVREGKTLNILKGTRIYMHQNARMFVFGKLIASGTKQDSIIFQGDRLDRAYYGYEGYPGEWGGIYFDSYSTGSEMTYVVLRNCGRPSGGAAAAAIQLAPDSTGVPTPGNQLKLNQCTIENSIGYGILAFNGRLKATNCLINSCGANTLGLAQGGNYEFDNCTIVTYGNSKISHAENSVVYLANFYEYDEQLFWYAPLNATFRNCVVAGSLEDEFFADSLTSPDVPAKATINVQNCLLKTDPTKIRPWVTLSNNKYALADGTLDPMFVDVNKWNFRPKQGSPLVDAGIGNGNTIDLDNLPRTGTPDIGAYEYR